MNVPLAASALLAVMAGPALAADPQGLWLTEGKDAALTITDCGDRLCGRIIWMESATDRNGLSWRDGKNPDPAKQTQRICGLAVIIGFRSSGPNNWAGEVYDPRDGKTYSGSLTVLPDGALRVRAYIALPIFGQSQTWTRLTNLAFSGGDDCRRLE